MLLTFYLEIFIYQIVNLQKKNYLKFFIIPLKVKKIVAIRILYRVRTVPSTI